MLKHRDDRRDLRDDRRDLRDDRRDDRIRLNPLTKNFILASLPFLPMYILISHIVSDAYISGIVSDAYISEIVSNAYVSENQVSFSPQGRRQ